MSKLAQSVEGTSLVLQELEGCWRFAYVLVGSPEEAWKAVELAWVEVTSAPVRLKLGQDLRLELLKHIAEVLQRQTSPTKGGALWKEVTTIAKGRPGAPMDAASLELFADLSIMQRALLVLVCIERLSYTDAQEVLGINRSDLLIDLAEARRCVSHRLALSRPLRSLDRRRIAIS